MICHTVDTEKDEGLTHDRSFSVHSGTLSEIFFVSMSCELCNGYMSFGFTKRTPMCPTGTCFLQLRLFVVFKLDDSLLKALCDNT